MDNGETWKERDADWTLPGFMTETCAVPGVVNRLAGIVACNCTALIKLVARVVDDPPPGGAHCNEAPDWKFAPLAVMFNAAEFRGADVGLIELSVGAGAIGSVTPDWLGVPLADTITAWLPDNPGGT